MATNQTLLESTWSNSLIRRSSHNRLLLKLKMDTCVHCTSSWRHGCSWKHFLGQSIRINEASTSNGTVELNKAPNFGNKSRNIGVLELSFVGRGAKANVIMWRINTPFVFFYILHCVVLHDYKDASDRENEASSMDSIPIHAIPK